MLKFRVEGQKLTWENPDEVVVAGTKKYLECYFEFDGDAWSGFEYIEAFFKNGRDKPIRMLLSANRIWKEDGLCLTAGDWSVYLCATTYNAEKEEIERQITSSSVSIRVLAHGQFEDAQNSFESPEIANQYIAAMQVYEEAREKAEDERVEAENARNVFEEYNPDKTYVKGNKVSYEGSSYVLTADEALGTNPTDKGSWLCIAKKGDKGVTGGKIFSYALGYGKNVEVGSYISGAPPYELINEGIDYGDIIVDTDGGCIFQYVAQLGGDGDDNAVLPSNGLHCIANPNGDKGDKGDKGEQGVQGVKGEKGDKGDKGVTGGKIFSYALGYGKNVEVGSYISGAPPYELINEGIDYGDIIVDTDGGCIFQYVAQLGGDGDDNAVLPSNGLHCIANPNGDKGDKGDKGEQGVQGIKGDKGDKGKDGTLWTPLYFELDTKKGENKKAQFEFSRNIFRFGFEEYYGLYMDDYPNVYEWTAGDFFVSNNGKILQIKQLEWINSELLNADVVCISEHNLIVDQVFDGYSENAISGKALAEVLKVLSEQLAFADFSNVSNEDFRAKAEEAGVGGGTSGAMVFKGVVSELPDTANEGEVYKITNTTTSNLYVRHNGEWVEISESGVTKAEMESYIEETLLGGEW